MAWPWLLAFEKNTYCAHIPSGFGHSGTCVLHCALSNSEVPPAILAAHVGLLWHGPCWACSNLTAAQVRADRRRRGQGLPASRCERLMQRPSNEKNNSSDCSCARRRARKKKLSTRWRRRVTRRTMLSFHSNMPSIQTCLQWASPWGRPNSRIFTIPPHNPNTCATTMCS